MSKYILITPLLFFIACKQSATQPVSDRDFMGIKAPVKQYTTTMYKNLFEKDGNWMPADSAEFLVRYTCYLSADGYIDSMCTWYKKPHFDDVTGDIENSRLILSKSITRIKDGKPIERLIYEDMVLKERQEIRTTEDSSIINGYNMTGTLVAQSITVLGKSRCPETNLYITYDSLGKEDYKKTQHWTRDENCQVTSVKEEEEDGKTVKTFNYKVLKSDAKYKFPLETHVVPQGETKPDKIYIRTVEYY